MWTPPPYRRRTARQSYTAEEVEFLMALDRWKRQRQRPFPRWDEVLAVARSLGWRKVAPPQDSEGGASGA